MTVKIRKFILEDVPYKVKWINDPKVNKYLHYDLPLEIDKTEKWFDKVKDKKNRLDFTITYEDIPVGIIGLLNIDAVNKNGEYYITLGDTQYTRKGISKAASELLFEYLREETKLKEIYLYTEVENIAAQKLFEKLGFKKIELIKNDLELNGGKIDRFYYTLSL